jgi:transcriptional regulator with XRE-family HTH domain
MIKGDRLKELRLERGLSREDLAKVINVGSAQIYRYEAEKTDPSSDVLVKFALYFKVSTEYLVGLAIDRHPPEPAAYADYDWPPATTDELFLLEHFRKHDYLEAMEIILNAHAEWKNNPFIDLLKPPSE